MKQKMSPIEMIAFLRSQIRIAIDFDGAIRRCGSNEPRKGVKEAIDFFRGQGHTIIVYTVENDLGETMRWLRKKNINFDEILSRLIPVADFYICKGGIDHKNWKSTLRKLNQMKGKRRHKACQAIRSNKF